MLATSSTEDITLVSKKKVGKTRSSDASYRFSDSFVPFVPQDAHSRRGKSEDYLLSESPRGSYKTKGEDRKRLSGGRNVVSPLQSSQKGVVTATDIDTEELVLVASQDNTDYKAGGNAAMIPSSRRDKASSCSPSRAAPPTLKTIQVHAHSRSFDSAPVGSKGKHRAPPPSQAGGGRSRGMVNGRQNSTENSDSGHESMAMDSDLAGGVHVNVT